VEREERIVDERAVVKNELARMLGVLSHPHRIRIVEELRDGEKDVSGLQAALGVSQSVVSQHLATLRSSRMVAERREGRHVFYRLVQPELFTWLADGLAFVTGEERRLASGRDAVEQARELWAEPVSGD
jgi:DNA-binding transcriptional ArsR family regulator